MEEMMGVYVNYTLKPGITQWLRDKETAKGADLLRTSDLRFRIRELMAKNDSFETQQDRDNHTETLERLKEYRECERRSAIKDWIRMADRYYEYENMEDFVNQKTELQYNYGIYVGNSNYEPVEPAKFPLKPDDRIYLLAKWSHVDVAEREERKDFVSVNQDLWSVVNFAAAAGFVETICIEHDCAWYCPGLLGWMLDNMNPETAAVLERSIQQYGGFMRPEKTGYDAKIPLEAWI
ncbi:MAG: hypothetical protein LVS60_05505 [Nodosilinea sp. LVE1205-7]